jgi:hypothetical protein
VNEPLDELYLTWLYGQVGSVKLKNPSRTYWFLARQLYKKEFVWFVPNDDNRVEDGRDLRHEFLNECEISWVDPEWMSLPCSIFELLLGLARRLSFEAEGEPRHWFWHLLENLDLRQFNDRMYSLDKKKYEGEIDECLDILIWRRYLASGEGGLFPLENPEHDQREVEIWYQLNEYLLEQG